MDDSLSNGSILWTVQVITSSTEDENLKKKLNKESDRQNTVEQMSMCPLLIFCL